MSFRGILTLLCFVFLFLELMDPSTAFVRAYPHSDERGFSSGETQVHVAVPQMARTRAHRDIERLVPPPFVRLFVPVDVSKVRAFMVQAFLPDHELQRGLLYRRLDFSDDDPDPLNHC